MPTVKKKYFLDKKNAVRVIFPYPACYKLFPKLGSNVC